MIGERKKCCPSNQLNCFSSTSTHFESPSFLSSIHSNKKKEQIKMRTIKTRDPTRNPIQIKCEIKENKNQILVYFCGSTQKTKVSRSKYELLKHVL